MNICRLVLPAALLSFLSACAVTPNSIIEKAPDAVYSSSKPTHAIAECIVANWENAKVLGGSAIANMRPAGAGYRITLHFGTTIGYLVAIEATDSGSKTTFWTRVIAIGGPPPAVVSVAKCQ